MSHEDKEAGAPHSQGVPSEQAFNRLGSTRPATIKDVAAAAGVSIATVSKFVNKQQSFSPEVEARLRNAIASLGYRRNPAAHSIATGRTGAIGLAALDICNLHHAKVIKGANRVAQQEGCSLLVVDIEEQPHLTEQVLESLALRVDGLIVSSRIPKSAVEWLAYLGKPVVYVGWPPKDGIVSIRTDSHLAATMLGVHLCRQRCRRIGYVGYPGAAWNAERLRGLKDSAESHGAEVIAFATDGLTAAAGEKAAARVLHGPEKLDALVGCNDSVAIGLLMQAKVLGFRVPEDLCVAGFDNIEPSRYVDLTTVDMGSQPNGEHATRRLLSMIRHKPIEDEEGHHPFLVVRSTTGRRTEG